MSSSERYVVIALWTGMCFFASLWYLSGSLWIAFIAGIYACGSTGIGLGARRLTQAGVLLPLIAIAVALGFPPPSHWPALIAQFPDFIAHIKVAVAG